MERPVDTQLRKTVSDFKCYVLRIHVDSTIMILQLVYSFYQVFFFSELVAACYCWWF